MGSSYGGVDLFSPNLTLPTDLDQPSAVVFRVPYERLLDNDTHLKARAVALEGIGAGPRLTGLEASAGTESLTPIASNVQGTVAVRTIGANEAVVGTAYRFSAQIQVVRGSTASAVDFTLELKVGADSPLSIVATLNTTNGYTGTARIEGEITFFSAPGAAASYVVTGVGHHTIVSATPVVVFPTPSLVLVEPTNAPLVIAINVYGNTLVAGVTHTRLHGSIRRIRS